MLVFFRTFALLYYYSSYLSRSSITTGISPTDPHWFLLPSGLDPPPLLLPCNKRHFENLLEVLLLVVSLVVCGYKAHQRNEDDSSSS